MWDRIKIERKDENPPRMKEECSCDCEDATRLAPSTVLSVSMNGT